MRPEKVANSRMRRLENRRLAREAGGTASFDALPPPPDVMSGMPSEGAESAPSEEGSLWSPTKVRKGGRYYQSAMGLSKIEIPPLFLEPVELVANARRLEWQGTSVVRRGTLTDIQPAPVSGLTKFPQLAVDAEDTLRAFSGLDDKTPVRRIYFRRLALLRFMRATWDAACMGYQVVRHRLLRRGKLLLLNSGDRRTLHRLKIEIIRQPEAAAARLKQAAADARGWYFGKKRPNSHLLRPLTQRWMGLAYSYIGRSLPAPIESTGAGIIDLTHRLTESPVPEVAEWRPFVKEFLTRNFAKLKSPANLRTDPSGHAALGYPRARGGHSVAVQDLVAIGYFLGQGIDQLLNDGTSLSEQTDISRFRFSRFGSKSIRSGALFKGRVAERQLAGKRAGEKDYKNRLSHAVVDHQEALERACFWVLDQVDHIPVMPIEAGEKGLKTRFPTTSLTACNLVQQILRKSIDAILIQDCRMAEGLGAPKASSFKSSAEFYSQDMSFATDMHPFWLTRAVYEELAELDTRLQKYLPYYDKLFGPRRLVLNTKHPSCDISEIRYYQWGSPVSIEAPALHPFIQHAGSDFSSLRLTMRGKVPLPHVRKAIDYMAAYREWLREISGPGVGPLTKRGAMMGDPTSFPVMPLMSAFAARAAHHSRFDGMLTGDDAAYSGFGRSKIAPYEAAMQSVGGVISVKKTEWHRKKAIFCEAPYYEGRKIGFQFLSNWVAPPGGSKGEVNWITQSLTVVQQNKDAGRPSIAGLWEHSPLWRSQQAAYLMGLPIGAAPEFGGGNHPRFSKTSTKWHASWLGYLTQMPLAELISGSGLGVFPSPYQDVRRIAADFVVKEVSEAKDNSSLVRLQLQELVSQGHDLDGFEPPESYDTQEAITDAGTLNRTFDEVCDEAASPLIKNALYYRTPIEPGHVPSIRRAVRKFQCKVVKSRPWNGTYAEVAREVRRRKAIYVTRGYRLPKFAEPAYGLERTTPLQRARLSHWVEGRVAFR